MRFKSTMNSFSYNSYSFDNGIYETNDDLIIEELLNSPLFGKLFFVDSTNEIKKAARELKEKENLTEEISDEEKIYNANNKFADVPLKDINEIIESKGYGGGAFRNKRKAIEWLALNTKINEL